jgi:tetratricopeptide (TPR) repeat protein
MDESKTAVIDAYMDKEMLTQEDVAGLKRLFYGSEKSRDALKKALTKLESDSSAKRNAAKAYKLALIYWFVDREEEAIDLLGKHLKSPDAYRTYVGWCLAKRRFAEACKKAAEGAKQFSSDVELKLLFGEAAVRNDDLKTAEKIVAELRKSLPALDMEKLRKEHEEAAKLDMPDSDGPEGAEPADEPEEPARYPHHSGLFYLEGLIEEAGGNWGAAIDAHENAVLADSQNVLAHFRKAYNLDLRGQDEEAIETYEAARHLRPLPVNVLFNLAVLYEDARKHKKAIQCYKAILEDNPNHDRAKLFLSDAEASKNMIFDEEEEKEQDKLLQILNTPITDFELSVRSRNCLAKMNIRTLGDLSKKTESELLSYKNFGETSLAEIKALLTTKGLSLGMGAEDFLKGRAAQEETEEAVEEELEGQPDLMATPLATLGFSIRCKRAFERLDLNTLGELAQTRESDFQGLRNFGQTSFSELRAKLAELGLALRPD